MSSLIRARALRAHIRSWEWDFYMNVLISRCSHLRPSFRQNWYAIPLRLIIGYGFMAHGYAKLARGPEHFTNILHVLGMPTPELLAWATIIVEFLGGFAVLVGAFIPLASIPISIVLLVAIFPVHLPNGFSSIKLQSVTAAGAHFGQPGYETDLMYLAGLIALVLGDQGLWRSIGFSSGVLRRAGPEIVNRIQAAETSSMKRNEFSFLIRRLSEFKCRFECGLNNNRSPAMLLFNSWGRKTGN